jgi:hypothetical protein
MSSSFRHTQLLQQKLENLPEFSAGRQCRTLPKFWCDTPSPFAVNLESYKEWFTGTVGFYRGCSPFNCVEQFPTPSTDRVAVILQFTWFVVGVKRSYFVSAPVPAPWQILAMLPQPHRLRSIADQPV